MERRSSLRAAVALLCLSAGLAFRAPVAACQGASTPDAVVSGKDIALPPPAGGNARFRFLPDGLPMGQWIRFDREIRLGAATGESREYSLEIDEGNGAASSFRYVIDKRRPKQPTAEPEGGLFHGPVSPELRCEPGCRALWAILGPGGGAPAFLPLGPDSRPTLAAPRSGVVTYALVAYAEDGAGNRSELARFMYRIAEAGLPAEPPPTDAPPSPPAADPSLERPKLALSPGKAELSLGVAEGARLLVAANPPVAPRDAQDFISVEPEDGVARFLLACPYGWSGRLCVYYGLSKDGVASYSPDPLEVELAYPAEDAPAIAAPEDPGIIADPLGRGSYLVFPSYDGTIFLKVGDADWEPYAGPVALDAGRASVELSWRGEQEGGFRSPTRSARLSLPSVLPQARLLGIEDGAVVGKDLSLVPSVPATIRYELRSYELRSYASGSAQAGNVDALPPEPTATSSLAGEGISIDCPQGEARRFALRYRVFADASATSSASDGELLRFTIDHRPPDPPKPLSSLPSYSNRVLSLSFETGEPGSVIFASVSVDGSSAPFEPVSGSLEFPGSEKGSVQYVVRAYCVDAAGNRSAEMESIALVVDHSSVYAASDAPDSGDGSPARPYRSLEDAFAAAIAERKRSVNLRGSFELSRSLELSAPLDIVGGFGEAWRRDRSARASISVAVPAGAPAIMTRGASLACRNLAISFVAAAADSAGPAVLFGVEGASLTLEDCQVEARGDGDVIVARASSATLDFSRDSIAIERAMSAAIARADDSKVALRDSVISARAGTRAFAAFDLEGGSLALEGSLIESQADLALRLLSLRGSALVADRCLVRASSGSGYLRLGSFYDVEGEIRNSRFFVAWKGDGLLFELAGASPAFRHLTVVAEGLRGKLDFFRSAGEAPEIWDSILSCPSGGGVMLDCASLPPAGRLVADCAWGFETLVAGPARLVSIGELDALNRGSAAFAGSRHVSEPPSRTFSPPVKGLSSIARGSACVDAAYPIPGSAYANDFSGAIRPSPAGKKLPDIGAEELGD